MTPTVASSHGERLCRLAARTGVSRTELDPTSFLYRSAAVHADRVAVVSGDLRRTYAELAERVNRLASALRANGIERHDRVAALCPNVPELLEAPPRGAARRAASWWRSTRA